MTVSRLACSRSKERILQVLKNVLVDLCRPLDVATGFSLDTRALITARDDLPSRKA